MLWWWYTMDGCMAADASKDAAVCMDSELIQVQKAVETGAEELFLTWKDSERNLSFAGVMNWLLQNIDESSRENEVKSDDFLLFGAAERIDCQLIWQRYIGRLFWQKFLSKRHWYSNAKERKPIFLGSHKFSEDWPYEWERWWEMATRMSS